MIKMSTQNPTKLHDGKITETTTEPPRADGQPNTHVQVIKRKKLLYIMLYYYGAEAGGGQQFKLASGFKSYRLQYGDFNILDLDPLKEPIKNREVKQFTFYKIKDFKEAWTKIYDLANQDQYYLQEVHLLGHGGHDVLYFKNESFTYELVKTLEVLPFTDTGALVLHACRSGRYEDNKKDDENNINENCIARAFSTHLKVKVIGQMTFSLFNPVTSLDGVKYFDYEIARRGLSIIAPNLVLWAYRIGNAVKSKHGQESDYNTLSEGQLFPARVFYPDGRTIYNVGKDMFNDSDLKYI